MPTLRSHVASARQRLMSAGIGGDEAALDARLLAEFVLGWDAARLLAEGREEAPPAFLARYDALVARRQAREPIAYIIGRQEFWGLSFEVSPDVLIPRPETELIVEAALRALPPARGSEGPLARNAAAAEPDSPLRVADIGTGSGCLAVALALSRADVRVIATDISRAALQVAARNVARHGVERRVALVRADLLAGIAPGFDLVVSNPPYVPDGDRDGLQAEVRDHEPSAALFAGHDGLDAVRRIVGDSVHALISGGTLMFEFGFGQAEAVERLLSAAVGLTMIDLLEDLQGIPRVAVATRDR